jgi:hypothetical protein
VSPLPRPAASIVFESLKASVIRTPATARTNGERVESWFTFVASLISPYTAAKFGQEVCAQAAHSPVVCPLATTKGDRQSGQAGKAPFQRMSMQLFLLCLMLLARCALARASPTHPGGPGWSYVRAEEASVSLHHKYACLTYSGNLHHRLGQVHIPEVGQATSQANRHLRAPPHSR